MLNEYLKSIMDKHEITQSQLAANVGVTRSAVCYWLQGKRTPNLRILDDLIKYVTTATGRSRRMITLEIMEAVFFDVSAEVA